MANVNACAYNCSGTKDQVSAVLKIDQVGSVL